MESGANPPPHTITGRPVLVGVNASTESMAAVQWAADEAGARQLSLRLVHARGQLARTAVASVGSYVSVDSPGEDVVDAAEILARARQVACGTRRDVDVHCDLVDGDSMPILLTLGRQAGLLVVGTSHLRRPIHTTLTSRAFSLARRAPVPVVVVDQPGGSADPAPSSAEVLVVVEEASSAADVLAFAYAHAAARGRPLRILARANKPDDAARAAAEEWLFDTLAGWHGHYPAVATRASVPVEWQPSLRHYASRAGLVVIAARRGGHGPGRVLRSMRPAARGHSRPVAVVPTGRSALANRAPSLDRYQQESS